jgi:endonuclease-3
MIDLAARKKRVRAVLKILRREFPRSRCSLDHRNPFQLLVATILSAQCTDARVNQVTPELFKQFPTPRDYAEAPLAEIEGAIRSTGFYKNKAKALQGAACAIQSEHGGQVPRSIEELVTLPGVGRKTANVVLGNAWNTPDGIVVDTHVARITRKLGLTDQKDPEKIERQLDEITPRKDWVDFAHLFIDHGRKTCRARAPLCDSCPIYAHCEVRG